MESLNSLIESMDESAYLKLRTAIEIGKWSNGVQLTAEQKVNSMQLLIAYESKYKHSTEKTGYVEPKDVAKVSACDSDRSDPIRIITK